MREQPLPLFKGSTYDEKLDEERLKSQLGRVRQLMGDGKFRTLAEIATAVKGSEAGVSARLRDLRRVEHGGYTIDRHRLQGGLWVYRMLFEREP